MTVTKDSYYIRLITHIFRLRAILRPLTTRTLEGLCTGARHPKRLQQASLETSGEILDCSRAREMVYGDFRMANVVYIQTICRFM